MDEFRDCKDILKASKYKHERTIIHIDIDCFYAQVEILKNPELANKPVGIKQQHYIITCNYVAREYGVKKCMQISEALAFCPKLVIINGEDLHDYRIMSSKVSDVIKQFTNNVEKLGLDENYIDVTDLVMLRLRRELADDISVNGHIYLSEIEYSCTCRCKERITIGSHIASEIRQQIGEELGLTCCAGIAHNKLLAKLVGSTHKPNQQTSVFPCSAITLVSNLNHIRAIPGIGRKSSDILDAVGISSVNDVQHASLGLMEKHLDKTLALWIIGACFGVDDTEVKESGKQQVIGLEEASTKISSFDDVCNRLRALTDRGMLLLQEDGRFPTTVRVSVRKYSSEDYTRQRESKQCSINPSIFRASNAKEHIVDLALSLFKKLVDTTCPFHLTLIGLAFTKFQIEVPAKSSLLPFLSLKNEVGEISKKPETQVTDNNTSNWKRDFRNIYCLKSKHHKLLDNTKTRKQTNLGDIDESVLNELPEDLRLEVLKSYSHHTSQSSSSSHSSPQANCPPGVDAEVFDQLPYDIQMELIQEANLAKPQKIKSSLRQHTMLNYLKK